MNPSGTRHLRRVVWAIFGAAVASLAGCGIGNEASPRVIGPNEQPFVHEPTSVPSATTAPTGGPKLYLISTDNVHLVASARDVASRDDLLKALLLPLTKQDNDRGLHTFIPIGTTLAGTSIANGILTIRLTVPADQAGLEGANAPKAYGQLVYTATDSPDVSVGVLFIVNSQQVHPFDANGKPLTRPANRLDYALFAPVGLGADVKPPGGVATTTTAPPPTYVSTTTSTTEATTTTTAAATTTTRK